MTDNTIFDDVFRTMLEKMPELIIPVINEEFQTSYSENEKIVQYRNEHQTEKGKRITDSWIGVRDKKYHIECQSSPDHTMVVRMFEYDISVALEDIHYADHICEMKMPRSCVLYLRHTKNTPKSLKLRIVLQDGNEFFYEVPVIKVQEYTMDEIFRKKLFFFLPYYLMRYEKYFEQIEQDEGALHSLIKEYTNMRHELAREFQGVEKADRLIRLMNLIERVSNYMLQSKKKMKKGIGDVMGGKVLELWVDQMIVKGEVKGEAKAQETFIKNCAARGMKYEDISALVEVPVERVAEILK